MNIALGVGLVLTAVGVLGYAVGISTAYPGRSFSVTAVIVGITLAAVGNAERRGRSDDD